MENNNVISRNFDKPTIVTYDIKENCLLENTMIGGYGTAIIDRDFIEDMNKIAESIDTNNSNLIAIITDLQNKIYEYFYSKDGSSLSREKIYDEKAIVNEDGMVIGTKISDLKGMNVALCSEKSTSAYIILKNLYDNNKISRKPSLILSYLREEFSNDSNPHAFVTISKEDDLYPTKHLLYDIENPSVLEDDKKESFALVGVYALTDEEKEDIDNGYECTPTSLYEIISNYKEINAKRVYGSKDGKNNKKKKR